MTNHKQPVSGQSGAGFRGVSTLLATNNQSIHTYMKTIHTTIKGYDVELEIDLSEDPITQCWVEKGDYSGSLARLAQTGTLDNSSEMELKVPDRIIDEIEDWADANHPHNQ